MPALVKLGGDPSESHVEINTILNLHHPPIAGLHDRFMAEAPCCEVVSCFYFAVGEQSTGHERVQRRISIRQFADDLAAVVAIGQDDIPGLPFH